jgi:D-beta-D-heptose 7-phosphate kinase/D-beta-D-heptose 1-phosphate adenosyltransferase
MSFVERFSEAKILCVGDVMVDRFVSGTVERISPESPVPIFSVRGVDVYPGGAANVARNIAALGGCCTLVGVVGSDGLGSNLTDDLLATGNIRPTFVICADRPTTEKTRFVAQGQHLLRADHEVSVKISRQTEDELVAIITAQAESHHVIVLSDYGKGVLTDNVIRRAIFIAKEHGIPVIVDPKSKDLSRYNGATLITPNSKEIGAATGIDPSVDDAAAIESARRGLDMAEVDAILVTRAEKGMMLVQRDGTAVSIKSCAREVFDVVGAGDTVMATLSLALGVGADLENASRIANVAAGIVVGRRGTSTVGRLDLLEELNRESGTGLGMHGAKVVSMSEAGVLVKAWRSGGQHIGFTNGCFDILHIGHIRLLEFARAQCDRLVVGLNSDSSARGLKGPDRPINNQTDRAELLSALGTVDAVIIFDEATPKQLIEFLAPDVLVKGADYSIAEIVGADFVKAQGGKVVRFEIVPGKSSSSIIDKARKGKVS